MSEAVEEKEVDLVTLLATQSEESNEEVVDEYTPVDELPSDPDELRELLLKEREIKSKRNKTIKKRDDALHRMQEEQKALQDQVKELMNMNQPAQDNSAQNAEYKEIQQKWADSVAEKPELAIEYANMQAQELRNNVSDTMAKMQETLMAQIAELKGEVDPEKVKYRGKAQQLMAIPEYADMSEDEAIRFIKATEKLPVAPRGSVGGRRPAAQPSEDDQLKELKAQYKKQLENR